MLMEFLGGYWAVVGFKNGFHRVGGKALGKGFAGLFNSIEREVAGVCMREVV